MADQKVDRVVVTVGDQHLSTIQSVAGELRKAGMQVTNVMPTTGIITGEVSSGNIQTLTTVTGVVSVEPDQEMHAL